MIPKIFKNKSMFEYSASLYEIESSSLQKMIGKKVLGLMFYQFDVKYFKKQSYTCYGPLVFTY